MVSLKTIQKTLLTLFALGLFTSNLFALTVEAEYIPSDKYFEVTLNELNNAKESIEVYMYLISIFPDQPDSQSQKLVEALIKAKERGLHVRIILDQTIDFTQEQREETIYQNKNQQAFELLKVNCN